MTCLVEQDDVLRKKGHTTRSSLGLQQWGDEATPEAGQRGSAGTAERQGRIARGQKEHEEAREGADDDARREPREHDAR